MNHAQIINRWPSLSEFASDLEIQYGTAKAMRRRGSIPPEYWPAVIRAADERHLDDVSLEALAVTAKPRSKPIEERAT